MHAIQFRHRSRRLFCSLFGLRRRKAIGLGHRLGAISVLAGGAIATLSGCQYGGLSTPLARHRALDNSPPSIHGPSMAGPVQGQAANKLGGNQGEIKSSASQVQVTSENAVPETKIEPVEQRLATTRQVAHRTTTSPPPADTRRTMSELAGYTAPPPSQTAPVADANQPSHHTRSAAPEIAQVSASMPIEPEAPAPSLDLPQNYSGVDISDLINALQGVPPEIQKAAVTKLIASAHRRARETDQPWSIDDALAAAFDELPDLPTVVPDRDVKPARIGISQPAANANIATALAGTERTAVANAVAQPSLAGQPAIQQASLSTTDEPALGTLSDISIREMRAPDAVAHDPQRMTFSDQEESPASVSMSLSDSPPVTKSESTSVASSGVSTLSDAELFDALVARLQQDVPAESDADRHRRQVVARHLMVLSGDPDRAVDHLEGLSEEEAQYLRHQLLGLWKIVDPKGHPVPSHRFSSALPEIRKATGYLAAASDSLEVRGLEFCTEIEAYGQIKPFPNRRFAAGQEVILYCEIDNFVANSVDGGFETRLRGSYDLLDADGQRIASQTLPEDHQISKNHLRDYFIAYQMYLPDAIDPGRYQLRLTMEDIHGKKYGQATVEFEIKR